MSTKLSAPMRVIAIASADDKEIKAFGPGVYVGQEVQPDLKREVPKINLDNGSVVWGNQCHWGPEQDFETFIQGREVVEVPVPETNGKWIE